MSERRYEVARLADIDRLGRRIPIRQHFEVGAFGINAFVADEAGGLVINEHDEIDDSATQRREEELYLVLSGHATFTLDGEEFDAPVGTVVFVPDPTVRRGARAREGGTTVLAIGGARGKPYEVASWEAASGFWPFYEAGDFAGAIAYLEQALEQDPGNSGIRYNLACCQARAGRHEEAIAQLLTLRDNAGLLRQARSDEDLVSIRDDPRFPA